VIREESRRQGVSPELVHAVVAVESAYDPDAKSHAGAIGLMQLMPSTATRYEVRDRSAPRENLRGGISYLRDLLHLYAGDLRRVIAAYNAGEAAVAKYGGIPPYSETKAFVDRVFEQMRRENSTCWEWAEEIEQTSWGKRCVAKVPRRFGVKIDNVRIPGSSLRAISEDLDSPQPEVESAR